MVNCSVTGLPQLETENKELIESELTLWTKPQRELCAGKILMLTLLRNFTCSVYTVSSLYSLNSPSLCRISLNAYKWSYKTKQ